jgi:hypothetical protein
MSDGDWATYVEVRDIDHAKEGVLGDGRMEDAFNCGEVSSGGSNRVVDDNTITSACTFYSSHNLVALPLLGRDLVVVGGFLGGFKTRG